MAITSTAKKSSTKIDTAKSAHKTMASKPNHMTHPPWIDMITECITAAPDGARHGVSRPAIKKFVDAKYHLEFSPLISSQLNRAIHQGADKGKFVLPKGPSGKVKLAPRKHNEAAKENTKPASKRSTAVKESQSTPVKATPKAAVKKASRTTAKPVAATEPVPLKSRIGGRKYHSASKQAKAAGTSTRKKPGRKATTARSTVKKTTTGRTTASKTRRGAASAKRTTRAATSRQGGKGTPRK